MTKNVLNHFRTVYSAKYELDYPVSWGRDMAIVKRLLKTYDPEVLKKLIDDYMKLPDEFVTNSGHSLNVLPSQIPKIIAKRSKQKSEAVSGGDDARIIEEAKKQGIKSDEDF